MKIVRLVAAAVIVIVLLVFSLYNAQLVRLAVFDYQTPQLPLFLVLVIAFILGFAAAVLWSALRITQLRRQIGQMRREAEIRNSQEVKDPSRGHDIVAAP